MAEPVMLRTDGPHSPEYTKQVGGLFAESVRVLNYASAGSAPGFKYPGDVYTLLGSLYTGTERMPQLLAQLTGFLAAAAASGTLGDDQGHDPVEQVAEASYRLGEARTAVVALTKALQRAQNAIAGLYVKQDGAGNPSATGEQR